MVVGAWCWQDGGRRLRLAGCLDAGGAALLARDAARRTPPYDVEAEALALTGAGATVLHGALPGLGATDDRGRTVHDIRNSLAVLRLRLQLLGRRGAAPGEAVSGALLRIDEVAAAVERLAVEA